MIVIGERINTSRAPVEKAVADRDAEYIRQDVQAQEAAGAAYIDVNAAARIGHEMEDMAWLVEVVQDAVDLPLSLDSPDPSGAGAGLCAGRQAPHHQQHKSGDRALGSHDALPSR